MGTALQNAGKSFYRFYPAYQHLRGANPHICKTGRPNLNTPMIFLIPLILCVFFPIVLGSIITVIVIVYHRSEFYAGIVVHDISQSRKLNVSYFPDQKFQRALRLFSECRDRKQIVTLSTYHKLGTSDSRKGYRVLTFDDGFESFYHHALPILERNSMKSTIFPIVNGIGGYAQNDVFGPLPHLTKKQLREIASLGHEIGSHTMSHAALPYLSSKQVYTELRDSKRALEDILGMTIQSISFPYGSWTRGLWDTAQEVGYKIGTIYRGSMVHTCPENLYPVYGIYSFDSVDTFLAKLRGEHLFHPLLAGSLILPHFAKGTALWKFRPEYSLHPRKS